MVLSRPFRAPTAVYSDLAYQSAAPELIGGRRWALVTSAGWRKRGVVDGLTAAAGKPEAVIDSVQENPVVSDVLKLAASLPEVEVVVALGGGSVIDSAKAFVALQALPDEDSLIAHLMSGDDLPADFAPRPIIAFPTTSGAGSEVTRWATLWGDDKVKFSLTHPALYPSHAVLDPRLCASMPPGLTLSSGLDALSHALEAIWNRNHTDISDGCAVQAIALIRRHLAEVLAAPADLNLRRELQKASLLAALAMSTTQTALAHSISYPFTAQFGMPHGFACSFTLPEVAGYNAEADPDRVALAAEAFGCGLDEFPTALAEWLDGLGIGAHLDEYVTPAVTGELGDNLINRARAANNLRDVDGAAARDIAHRSLSRFCGGDLAKAGASG